MKYLLPNARQAKPRLHLLLAYGQVQFSLRPEGLVSEVTALSSYAVGPVRAELRL